MKERTRARSFTRNHAAQLERIRRDADRRAARLASEREGANGLHPSSVRRAAWRLHEHATTRRRRREPQGARPRRVNLESRNLQPCAACKCAMESWSEPASRGLAGLADVNEERFCEPAGQAAPRREGHVRGDGGVVAGLLHLAAQLGRARRYTSTVQEHAGWARELAARLARDAPHRFCALVWSMSSATHARAA